MTGRQEHSSTAIRVNSPPDSGNLLSKSNLKSPVGHRLSSTPSSPRKPGLAAKAVAAVAARKSISRSSPHSTPVTPAATPNHSKSSEALKKPRTSSASCSTPTMPYPPQKGLAAAPVLKGQKTASSTQKEMSSTPKVPPLPGKETGHNRVVNILERVGKNMQIAPASAPPEAEAASSPRCLRKRPEALNLLSVSPQSDFHTEMSMPQTPTETPNALTDAALRRSEQLLADLTALGFSEAKDDYLEENDYSCPSSSTPSPEPSSPVSLKDRKEDWFRNGRQDDMVEVPAAFLDLVVETWSRYRSMSQSNGLEGDVVDNERAETAVSKDSAGLQLARSGDVESSKALQIQPNRSIDAADGTWSPRFVVDSLASTVASISSPVGSTTVSPTFVDRVNRGLLSPTSQIRKTSITSAATDVPAEFLSTFSSTFSSSSDSSIARMPCQLTQQALDARPRQVMRRTSLPMPAAAQRVVVPAPAYSLAAAASSHGNFAQPPKTCTVEQTITVTTTYHIH